VALGQRLVGIAHACMDISDGLAGDLAHLCRASGVGAMVEAGLLPRSPAAAAALAAHPDVEPLALAGGDDYELLMTAPAEAAPALQALAGECGVQLTRIGQVLAGSGMEIRGADGRPIEGLAGWTHF
jgi:thiamine-monophosphate kinase